jgi:glyoxylase-like metal-dependent hydrolase (beta-lactamase superfamily II)
MGIHPEPGRDLPQDVPCGPLSRGRHRMGTVGHSPGHTSYIITAGTGTRLIALGDAFHIPAQLAHPEWPSWPDIDGNAALVARAQLIRELEQPDTLGFAFHFGDQAFGRLTRTQTGLRAWEPEARR